MVQSILVPFDYSRTAYECVRVGGSLARMFQAHLSVLHVFPLRVESHYLSERQLDALESQQTVNELQKLNESLQPLLLEFPDVEMTFLAEIGIPSDEILRIGLNYDLIVMGTQGFSGEEKHSVWKKFLGNTIETVVHNHSGPILLIPPNYRFQIPKKVLYLSPLREWSTEIRDFLVYLFEKMKFSLIIAHFLRGKGITEEMVQSLLEKRLSEIPQIPATYYFERAMEKDFSKPILQLIQREKIDLIITVSHKRSGLERVLNPSLSLQLYEMKPVPIWIYRQGLSNGERNDQ
jgi:nucleotide-binding universal stress UspA family protein